MGIVSLLHFVHDFSTKIFLMFYSINWPNFIVLSPLLLEILGNLSNAIVCFPGCDVINFETNLITLIKPFLSKCKKSRQIFKYLQNEWIELLRYNKYFYKYFYNKYFWSFLKGFQMAKIVPELKMRHLGFNKIQIRKLKSVSLVLN